LFLSSFLDEGRDIALEANLPRDQLAAELAITAIHIVNHTPTKRLDWETPYKLVHGKKPLVAHFELIGAKATRDVHFLRDNLDAADLKYTVSEALVQVLDIPKAEYPSEEELAHALLPRAQPNELGATPSAPINLDTSDVNPTIEDAEYAQGGAREKDWDDEPQGPYITPSRTVTPAPAQAEQPHSQGDLQDEEERRQDEREDKEFYSASEAGDPPSSNTPTDHPPLTRGGGDNFPEQHEDSISSKSRGLPPWGAR
ncbi:hypothetical protein EJ04DRAFT_601682, partial [Polyplosphaeria fusca]